MRITLTISQSVILSVCDEVSWLLILSGSASELSYLPLYKLLCRAEQFIGLGVSLSLKIQLLFILHLALGYVLVTAVSALYII